MNALSATATEYAARHWLRCIPAYTNADGSFRCCAVAWRGWGGLPHFGQRFTRRLFDLHPRAERLSLLLGPQRAGNLIVLDIDVNHGDGANGFDELRKLLAELGIESLPPTPAWRTRSGGMQVLFRAPEDAVIHNHGGKHALCPGVEIKARGSLATAPPSNSGAYRFFRGRSFDDLPIALLPPALLADILRRQAERRAVLDKCELADVAPAEAVEPVRFDASQEGRDLREWDDARRRRYVARAIDGIVADVANARPGTRNPSLRDAVTKACAWAKGPDRARFALATTLNRLAAAAKQAGLDAMEISATVRSAKAYGESAEVKPRAAPTADPDKIPRRLREPKTMQRQPARADAAHSR